MVAVEGRIQTRQWEDDRKVRHWKTEIVASSVEMLSGRRKKDYAAESAAGALEAQAGALGVGSDGPSHEEGATLLGGEGAVDDEVPESEAVPV